MAHVEEQIRSAFVALVTGLTPTGDNVFESKEHPLTPATLPGLCVYITGCDVTDGTFTATTKELTIAVDTYVEGFEVDTVQAEITKEVEEALYNSESAGRFFAKTVMNLKYDGYSNNSSDAGAVRHSVRKHKWICEYQTEDGDAETAR